MKKNLYSLLELDSIYGVISWEERMWIETHQWEAPKMEYKSDRLLYYLQNRSWREMEQYAKDFPLTTKTINELKLKYNR